MYRLGFGFPTVLQIHRGYAILFHEGSVSQLDTLRFPSSYRALEFPEDHRKRIWALVDMGPLLREPADIFKYYRPFFIVFAASHGSNRHEWLGKLDGPIFYMQPWSLSEVFQAYMVLRSGWFAKARALCSRSFTGIKGPHTERQLRELYVKFGAPPRSLARYATDPTTYESFVIREIIGADSNSLRYSTTLHHIFVIYPSPTNPYIFERKSASRHVFELLWENRLKNQISDMEYFYDQYRDGPTNVVFAR